MKKTLIIIVVMILLLSSLSLFAQSKKDLWMTAITEREADVKLQKLMEYKEKYDDPKDDNHLYLYLNLTAVTYQLKKFAETIELGEKTLQLADIQDNNKLDLYLILANSYNVTNQDLNKAAEYADMVVKTAQNLKLMSGDNADTITRMDGSYISPALRIQAKIYLQQGKNDAAMLMKAADKSIAAYQIDKQQTSLAFALTAFSTLANTKKFKEAASVLESIHKQREGSAKEFDALAKIYYQMDNKDKAIEYFEKAYQKKPSAQAASQLGALLQKQNPAKAIEYLADEFAFTDNRESQTFKLLEHLYFNVIYKDHTEEDKESGFKALLEAAKQRIVK